MIISKKFHNTYTIFVLIDEITKIPLRFRFVYYMTDMELDDELKLRVVIRLIDNSAATW